MSGVLSFEGRTVDEVYRHVRSWIDDYYEENRDILAYWSSVEARIERHASTAQRSLTEINAWLRELPQAWHRLRDLARLVDNLRRDRAGAVDELSRMAAWDSDVDGPLRTELRRFEAYFKGLDGRRAAAGELAARAAAIAAESDIDALSRHIKQLTVSPPPSVGPAVRSLASAAWRTYRELRRGKGPEHELLAWWQSSALPLFGRKQFFRWRPTWRRLAELAWPPGAGDVKDRLGEELAAFLAALGALPLTGDPADGAERVLAELAAYCGMATSTDWRSATATVQDDVAKSLSRLQDTAPSWLIARQDPLLLGECVPFGRWPDAAHLQEVVASLPRLGALIEVEQARRGDGEQEAAQQAAQILAYGHRIAEAINQDAQRLAHADSDRHSAVTALGMYLEGVRADRLQALVDRQPPLRSKAAQATAVEELTKLGAVLNEYQDAIARISYPHRRDPQVRAVQVQASLTDAAGTWRPPARPALDVLRNEISSAVQAKAETDATWPVLVATAKAQTPDGALLTGLTKAVKPKRLRELLTDSGGGTPTPSAVAVLPRMSPAEQVKLLAALDEGPLDAAADPAAAILVRLGLGSEPARETELHAEQLRDKISRSAFDIFLAHNSTDQPEALEIADGLRRQGIYPWIDVDQIRPGEWFYDAIQSAVRTVRSAGIVIGPAGVGRWQQLEIRTFVDRCVTHRVPVIPILLPGVAEVPEELVFLRELHHVRFRSTDDTEALQKLVWGVTGQRPDAPH
ncbi:toll/interleukin-1 receptor domain-containing protein [Dactylosporangium sp. NPDC049525]|uniref:toll/interleukin-1 receptor domain-containing protein n=1 Tax=Dactylosporangium sp. NPDC049525 TaxID=3154730 RepID=UPI0034498BEF